MKNWKRLLVLAACGSLLFGLSACGSQSQEKEQPAAAGSAQTEPQTESTGSAEDESIEEIVIDEETYEAPRVETEEVDAEEDDEEEIIEEEQDVSEDGEARNDITMDEALELVIGQFGTEDPDSGYAYEYTLERADEIDGQAYYIYKQTWAPDEEDAEAGAKVLRYIFIATDGSVLYTGVIDGEESVINYDTEVVL